MRAFVVATLTMILLTHSGSAQAQDKKKKEPSGQALTSQGIITELQEQVATNGFTEPMKFAAFVEKLREHRPAITFVVDEEAFADENGPDAPRPADAEITLRNLPAKTTLNHLLRQALKELPTKAAYVIRGGKVDIVPMARTAKRYMLNQTFHVDFKERALATALEDLSELTGVSVVIDPRAKEKAKTPVTARFRDDVALQDAVRLLTDMAELKIVYLVTGIYVTTPEHAAVLQKELKQIYEVPPGTPAGGAAPMFGVPFNDNGPLESPLAPPLPPSKAGRSERAA